MGRFIIRSISGPPVLRKRQMSAAAKAEKAMFN
jgi:hypothetical protein